MIKIENFCKPNATKLLGIKGAFDEEIEGELKPCPLCGRIPKPMVRVDSMDGYFSAVSCHGGKGISHAYVSSIGHGDYMESNEKPKKVTLRMIYELLEKIYELLNELRRKEAWQQ